MKNLLTGLGLLLAFMLTAGCEKQEPEIDETLMLLYQTYKDGEISECQLEGESVYTASLNRVDSPILVYDMQGNQVAECNYTWGQVDAACEQLSACQTIYRVKNHISGEPPVDKYGLGN